MENGVSRITKFIFLSFIVISLIGVILISSGVEGVFSVLFGIFFVLILPLIVIDLKSAVMILVGAVPLMIYLPLVPFVGKNVAIVLLLLVYILFFIKGRFLIKDKLNSKKMAVFIYFYIGVVISFLVGEMRFLSESLIHFVFISTGLALFIYFFFDSKNVFTYVLIILITAGAMTGLVGFYNLNTGNVNTIASKDYETGERYDEKLYRLNAGGLFDDANTSAAFFLMCLGFLVGFLFYVRKFFVKVLCGVGIIFFVYVIIMTASRMALLVLFFLAFLLFLKKGSIKFKVIAVVFVLLFLIIVPSLVLHRLSNVSISSGNRLEHTRDGLITMSKNPLGYGRGYWMSNNEVNLHNSFVLMGVELGIVSLFAFVYLLFIILKDIQNLKKRLNRSRTVHIIQGFELGVIAWFLMAATLPLPYQPITWVLVGLGLAVKNCFKPFK